MALSPDSRTGVAAILAGALIFAGQAGELAFENALNPLWVSFGVLGIGALVVAIWRLGDLVRTRIGRIGWRVSVAGVVLLGLFAVQTVITVALTGDIPENFILFGLGFLLLFVGHVLIATGLRDALRAAFKSGRAHCAPRPPPRSGVAFEGSYPGWLWQCKSCLIPLRVGARTRQRLLPAARALFDVTAVQMELPNRNRAVTAGARPVRLKSEL